MIKECYRCKGTLKNVGRLARVSYTGIMVYLCKACKRKTGRVREWQSIRAEKFTSISIQK